MMKTPERWRALPRRALFVSVLAQKSPKDVKTSWRDVMMLYHDVMTSYRDITWRRMMSGVMTKLLCAIHPSETSEIMFFNVTTLTFDLWPWPSKPSDILSRSMPPPNLGSVCQRVHRQTDIHTDRTDSIPSTADTGGKNDINYLLTKFWSSSCTSI